MVPYASSFPFLFVTCCFHVANFDYDEHIQPVTSFFFQFDVIHMLHSQIQCCFHIINTFQLTNDCALHCAIILLHLCGNIGNFVNECHMCPLFVFKPFVFAFNASFFSFVTFHKSLCNLVNSTNSIPHIMISFENCYCSIDN